MLSKSEDKRLRLLIVGVGGQGALTAARYLGDAALSIGLEVMVGQLHGMSQRGGSVECTVLIGSGKSTYVDYGQADIVLGLEPLEVLRALPKFSKHTKVIINLGYFVPFSLAMQGVSYPPIESILERVREVTPHLIEVDGPELIKQVGVSRALNVLMIGALSGLDMLPFAIEELWKVIEKKSPASFLEANKLALRLGVQAVRTKRDKKPPVGTFERE